MQSGIAPVILRPIGTAERATHYRGVKRLRALVAFLGCLAVLASGLMTVASAMPVKTPCSHCDDCDAPCPAPGAACLQACIGTPPPLMAADLTWPSGHSADTPRATHAASLSGLSPPPDPFPPRL